MGFRSSSFSQRRARDRMTKTANAKADFGEIMKNIGTNFGATLPKGVDWCVVILPLGAGTEGDTALASSSNVEPKRMAELLRTHADVLEKEE